MNTPHIYQPTVAITSGEPAGIGPDIILSALAEQDFSARLVILADPELLAQRAKLLNLAVRIETILDLNELPIHQKGHIWVWPIALHSPAVPGTLDVRNSPYVLETLKQAGQGCLDGQFDAIVTPPVHKGILCETGVHFSGHTEFFQAQCHSPHVVMMLASQAMKVALVTTHLPLKDVSAAITKETLSRVTLALHKDLQNRFGLVNPKILVCGLNPHAGEGGHLGDEEIQIIEPTLNELRQKG